MTRACIGLLVVASGLCRAGDGWASYGFTFTSEDTVKSASVGEMVSMYATLVNTGDLSDTIAVWGEGTSLPGDWFAQFCDTALCYPIIDPPTVKHYPMDPAASIPFEMKILPQSEAQGFITMFARSHGDTNMLASIQFRVGCPVGVDLASVDIMPGDRQVTLGWRVEGETIAGFHVHRATSGQPYERVTASLIVPDATGAASYVDSGLRNGVRYAYLIEAVDVGGDSEFLGPFDAVPGQSLSWGALKASYRWTALPTGCLLQRR
jgi:hypothetical protein